MGRWGHDRDDDTDGKPPYSSRRKNPTGRPVLKRPVPKQPTPPTPQVPRATLAGIQTGGQVKTLIKEILYDNPGISTAQLQTEIEKIGLKVSTIALSHIRRQYRETVRFLILRGATGLDDQLR